MSLDHVARICGSLEPALIARMVSEVCAELLGPSTVRLFTPVEDDSAHIVRFGLGDEDDSTKVVSPNVDGVALFGLEGSPIGARPNETGATGGAVVALAVDGEALGFLEATRERVITAEELPTLKALGTAVALALRNARTFERTRRLTFTDDLTALYNSRFMRLYLDRELKRCRRAHSSLSLLFMDLDGFKNVNDTHGHLAGSRTLVEVGALLEETVRDADVLIRYGGDEFVILFPETPLAGGLVIAERVRRAVSSTVFLLSMSIEARVSASIGIAAYPETADDVRSLISSADRAMYQAKALGKDRVVAASPLPLPSS